MAAGHVQSARSNIYRRWKRSIIQGQEQRNLRIYENSKKLARNFAQAAGREVVGEGQGAGGILQAKWAIAAFKRNVGKLPT
jgi:hypothetical protein